MTKLPQVKPKEIIKALERLGFVRTRTTGSHIRLKDSNGNFVTIAFHNRTLAKGILKSILRQADITAEELLKNIWEDIAHAAVASAARKVPPKTS